MKKTSIKLNKDINTSPEFNAKTKREFLKIKKDIKEGKNVSKSYDNAEDLFKTLKI